jgi:hypothetical protein
MYIYIEQMMMMMMRGDPDHHPFLYIHTYIHENAFSFICIHIYACALTVPRQTCLSYMYVCLFYCPCTYTVEHVATERKTDIHTYIQRVDSDICDHQHT